MEPSTEPEAMELPRGRDVIHVREFARAVGVSVDSVHRAIRRGEIASSRFGKTILIPKSELERIITPAIQPIAIGA